MDVEAANGAVRHGAESGFVGVLNDSGAVVLLNVPKARRTIIEKSGEEDSGDAIAVGGGSGTEHDVDARALHVFAWPVAQLDVAGRDDEMVIGRSYIDASGADGLTINGMSGGERARTVEQCREDAFASLKDMESDEDRGGQITLQ